MEARTFLKTYAQILFWSKFRNRTLTLLTYYYDAWEWKLKPNIVGVGFTRPNNQPQQSDK